MQVAGGVEHHAGSRFAVGGGNVRRVRAMVGGVEEAGAELAEELGVDGSIIRLGEVAAPDPALVGDHDEPEPGGVQASERGRGVGIDDDLRRMGRIVRVFHQGAVAVEENGGD